MKYRLMLAGVLSLALVGWIGAQAQGGPARRRVVLEPPKVAAGGPGQGSRIPAARRSRAQDPLGNARPERRLAETLRSRYRARQRRPAALHRMGQESSSIPITRKNGDYTGSCLPFGHSRAMGSPDPIQIMLTPNSHGVPVRAEFVVQGVPDRRPRAQPQESPDLVRRFDRPLGRRHHGGRHHEFQRVHAAGYQRASA